MLKHVDVVWVKEGTPKVWLQLYRLATGSEGTSHGKQMEAQAQPAHGGSTSVYWQHQ